MKEWIVETTAQVRRFYRVTAASADEAEDAMQGMDPAHEEEISEEIDSVILAPVDAPPTL
jgi:hypothetical protein